VDVCKAPCADDHNAPEWLRITCVARQARDAAMNRGYRIAKEGDSEVSETDERIIAAYREGKSSDEIADIIGKTRKAVDQALWRLRKTGVDLPRREPSKLIHRRTKAEMAEAAEQPAQPPAIPDKNLFDMSAMHKLLDMASQLPAMRQTLAAALDEIERSAQYQLHQVGEMRKAVGL